MRIHYRYVNFYRSLNVYILKPNSDVNYVLILLYICTLLEKYKNKYNYIYT